jgi:hypothetical protein
MYGYKLMYMCAPALEAAAPTVFMVWQRACTKASTYALDNTNTDQFFQVGLEPTIPVSEAIRFVVLVSKLPKISLLRGWRII